MSRGSDDGSGENGCQSQGNDDGTAAQDNGGNGSGGNGSGKRSKQNGGGGGQSSGKQGTSTAQLAVMVVSVLFTLSLLAYGGWQVVTAPEATTPTVSVAETETLPVGDVAVTAQLSNPSYVGLVSATVEANCTTPPPSVELRYVPASSTRRATLVCPGGTTDPGVSVTDWVRA